MVLRFKRCGSVLYSIPSTPPGQFIVSIHIAPTGTFVHIKNVFEDYISQIMFHQSSALQSGFVPKEEVADDGTEKRKKRKLVSSSGRAFLTY